MRRLIFPGAMVLACAVTAAARFDQAAPGPIAAAASKLPALGPAVVITEADCTTAKLNGAIAVKDIGEPVSAVTLSAPAWVAEAGPVPAYCRVDGAMAPVDTSATAKPINFRVALPASWTHRAAQIGGGGMNGAIPGLTGAEFRAGVATYGSDSGHQSAFGGPRGGPPAPGANDWAVNDESMKNLAYMQMKKTHDAAMVLISRAYGERARFNYYIGTSQGGREALTVVQRYPADYDGIIANVPIVNFSSLMLGPGLIRIQEKPVANWVASFEAKSVCEFELF